MLTKHKLSKVEKLYLDKLLIFNLKAFFRKKILVRSLFETSFYV
jgi:hypothetical protein